MNIITQIDNYLLQREHRPRKSHYPSDISDCMRKLYYKWTNEPESNPITASGLWKMEMGKADHKMLENILIDMEFDVLTEDDYGTQTKKIDGLKYPIRYRPDAIIMEFDGKYNRMVGIEAKFPYGRGIVAIEKDRKPKENDIAQICFYIYLTGINKFYLIYVGRDNAYRTQFEITKDIGYSIDDKIINGMDCWKFRNKLADLEWHIENEHIPNRDFNVIIKNGEIKKKVQKNKIEYKSDWQCLYCQWQETCWRDQTGSHR